MTIPPFGVPPLPAQSGNTGKFLNTDGSRPSWATPGSGQTLVTKVVAASGGDYTTLGAALTAASDGWSIYVRAGTYTESAISSAKNNITIMGENPITTIINMAGNNFNMTGSNVTLINLGFTFSTATFTLIGLQNCMYYNQLIWSGTTGKITFGSNYSIALGNFIDISSITTDTTNVDLSNIFDGSFSNNIINVKVGNTTLTKGTIKFGNFSSFTNNSIATISGGAAGALFQATGNSTVSNNVFHLVGSGIQTSIAVTSADNVISGNIIAVTTSGNGIYVNATENTIIGNKITSQGANGIKLDNGGNTVTGNFIKGPSTPAGTGVLVNGGDDNIVSSNRVTLFTTGINVTASRNRTVISGNAYNGNTTGLSDSGTGTISTGNST